MSNSGVSLPGLGNVTVTNITLGNNTATAFEAWGNNTLGFGFGGSGFLILYFTGIVSVLQSLGVISNTTRLAGSSGGALTAAAVCSGVTAEQQFDVNFDTAVACRPSLGCRGTLDSVVRGKLDAVLPAAASENCRHDLFVAMTVARPDNKTDPPMLVSNLNTRQQLIDAVAASSYLPFWSAPSATTQFEGLPVYDGGFSYPLPCPTGVTFCVKVSANVDSPEDQAAPQRGAAPVAPGSAPGTAAGVDAALEVLAASRTTSDTSSSKFIPLNPIVVPEAEADISPGLGGPLNVTAAAWNSYGLVIPSNDTLLYLYNQGRVDAAAWAQANGMAGAVEAERALQQTAVSL